MKLQLLTIDSSQLTSGRLGGILFVAVVKLERLCFDGFNVRH